MIKLRHKESMLPKITMKTADGDSDPPLTPNVECSFHFFLATYPKNFFPPPHTPSPFRRDWFKYWFPSSQMELNLGQAGLSCLFPISLGGDGKERLLYPCLSKTTRKHSPHDAGASTKLGRGILRV